jgi:hypothetical protein
LGKLTDAGGKILQEASDTATVKLVEPVQRLNPGCHNVPSAKLHRTEYRTRWDKAVHHFFALLNE